MIDWPSEAGRSKIAAILAAYDDLIENSECRIESLEFIKACPTSPTDSRRQPPTRREGHGEQRRETFFSPFVRQSGESTSHRAA